MLKEKTDLIMKDLNFSNLSNTDIATCLEMAYALKNNNKIYKLNEIILNYATDGINTFAMFVLFCYADYCKFNYWDIYEFLCVETEKRIDKFVERYFEEKEN